jgi:hypothetical protein
MDVVDSLYGSLNDLQHLFGKNCKKN